MIGNKISMVTVVIYLVVQYILLALGDIQHEEIMKI